MIGLGHGRREPLHGIGRAAGMAGALGLDRDPRRHELAAVRDQRVEARHLQRRDEQVLLPDRELDRVARASRRGRAGPSTSRTPACATRAWAEPGRLAAELDPGRLAEPEAARPVLERVAALRRQLVEPTADLVEVRVARRLERLRQRHPDVERGRPVVERVVDAVLALVDVRRRARHCRVRREEVLLHRRERRHRLPRRARRVDAGERPVEGRVVRLRSRRLGQPSRRELALLDAADEDVRLEGRIRGEREDLAVARVHGDDRAAVRVPLVGRVRLLDPVPQRALGGLLEADVDR